jgi:hypothetical protein
LNNPAKRHKRRIEKNIAGNGYNFRVVAERGDFAIEATHLGTLRYSSICNLNAMLSAINLDPEDNPRFEDSRPDLTFREEKHFFKKAVRILSDDKFCDYIEWKLDEDRLYGEWENIREPNWQSS